MNTDENADGSRRLDEPNLLSYAPSSDKKRRKVWFALCAAHIMASYATLTIFVGWQFALSRISISSEDILALVLSPLVMLELLFSTSRSVLKGEQTLDLFIVSFFSTYAIAYASSYLWLRRARFDRPRTLLPPSPAGRGPG